MKLTDEIYEKYGKTVYRYLMSLARDEHVAEEVTQETFYQAIKSIQRFDGSCQLSTGLCAMFAYEIAWNMARAQVRRHVCL